MTLYTYTVPYSDDYAWTDDGQGIQAWKTQAEALAAGKEAWGLWYEEREFIILRIEVQE